MIPDIVCSPSHSTCDSADVNTFIIPRIVKKILWLSLIVEVECWAVYADAVPVEDAT
jgi:hypothetical protein